MARERGRGKVLREVGRKWTCKEKRKATNANSSTC